MALIFIFWQRFSILFYSKSIKMYMLPRELFLSLIFYNNKGKKEIIACYKTFVNFYTKFVVPVQPFGSELYIGLLEKNIFYYSRDYCTYVKYFILLYFLLYLIAICFLFPHTLILITLLLYFEVMILHRFLDP